MLRRNTKRLCKVAACLATVAVVCYVFGKCEDYMPIVLRKIDGFSEQVNQLVPRMHTMLKSSLNDTTGADLWKKNRLALESGSYLTRKDQTPAQTSNRQNYNEIITKRVRKSQNKQLEAQRISFSMSQSDFIKVFDKYARRQSVEAEKRQILFEKRLINLTRILMEVHRREQAGSSVSEVHQEEGKHVNNPIYSRYKNENLTAKNVWNGKENKSYKINSAVQKDFAQLKTSMPSKKMEIPSTMAAKELPENLLKTETPLTRSNEVTFGRIKQLTHVKTTPTKGRPVLTSPSFTKGVERQNTSVELAGNILKKFAMHNKSLLSTTDSSSSLLTRRKKTNSRGNFSTESKTEISFSFKQKTASKLLRRNTTGKTTETIKNISSFKQQEKRFIDESTLRRRAEIFLRKIKDFGMTYSESFFRYKRQQNSAMFYREVLPVSGTKGRLTVFLLHDSDQDSRIWLSTGTLYSLGIQGHRVVALDLPGYGKSTNVSEPGTSLERLKLLASFMFTVSPKGPRVLVSAGESGLYSVPIVISASVMLKGVVFVSTAHTGKFPASNYENVHLPALVIHGENDNSAFLKVFLESMKHLSEAERISLEQSGRYSYIEKPDHFHRLLNKFLLKISPERKKHSNKSRLRRS